MKYRQEVQSTCLCEVRYDDEIPQLTVVFTRDKREANYPWCPKYEYDNLVAADSGEIDYSVGGYYNTFIKGYQWLAPLNEGQEHVRIPDSNGSRSPTGQAQHADSGSDSQD